MLILCLLNTVILFLILRGLKRPRKTIIKTKIEYYNGLTPAEFAEKQLWDSCPELRYEILRQQLEGGDIDKATYDNAIENLIKDISI